MTDSPPQAAPRGCGCAPHCAACDQPLHGRHDLYCPWTRGSEALETPAIPAAPLVAPEHTHRPGCPRVVRRPGPLFTHLDDERVACTMCGGVDTIRAEAFDSFGGTVEGSETCTACGQIYGWADISAIR